MKNTLKISKVDAAKDEISAALDMFMDYKYPLAVHVLTYSAHAILDPMARATNKGTTISQLMRDDLSKKKKKAVHDKLNASYNFLKHASRDFDKDFDFNPEQTEWVLLWAVNLFYDVVGYKTPLMVCFQLWMCKEHPEISWDTMNDALESGEHPAFETKDRRAYKDLVPPISGHDNIEKHPTGCFSQGLKNLCSAFNVRFVFQFWNLVQQAGKVNHQY